MLAIETRSSRRACIAGGILVTLPAQSQTRSPPMETTIRVDSAVVTLVNIFTVEPGDQPKMLALLQEGIETLFSKTPGWISSNIHTSRDGRRIFSYSQWRDEKDIEAFRQDPRLKPYFRRFDVWAKPEVFTCDVLYSLHA
jgi:quinol monooxygenase YgiN